MQMKRRGIFAALAAAGSAGVGAGLRPDLVAGLVPDLVTGGGLGAKPVRTGVNARIPDIQLVTHEGKPVRFYSDLVAGKVVLINAMFAGCGDTCPLVMANLLRVQEMLGSRIGHDIFMYSFTLFPETETPEILADFARHYEVGPGWNFLTGARADIEQLRVALGFYSSDPEYDVIADTHTGTLRYGNERRNRWSGCPALSTPEFIVKEVTETIAVG
jgi:protein SCO1/2